MKNGDDVQEAKEIHLSGVFHSHLSDESLTDVDLPFYVTGFFRRKSDLRLSSFEDQEREGWENQIEYLLSCIGYAVGLGNLWRFPSKVYQGGGGAFLIPYLFFCIFFGGPMMILEMSLGQFSGYGCSRSFELCPIFFGLGWTIGINTFFLLTYYTVVITWCMFYLKSSFESPLPWSVCMNSFNTPSCLNLSVNVSGFNVSNFELSTIEFWNYHVTGDKKPDGTYYKITDLMGYPNMSLTLCLIIVICLSCASIMFGVKITGKIVYITVLLPYIVLIQFVILGCTLPGAYKGIKFYLYPNPKKLLDPKIYLSALEQLFFSCGIATGGVITMSSFNRFQDNIYRNVFIVVFMDFVTSFIGGFATFPVLGYMSYRTDKDINDILKGDSSLFFITYPEALSTISTSNLWSTLFMLMALFLGLDSMFVLMDTVIITLFDNWEIFHSKNQKVLLTALVGLFTFLFSFVFLLPGGLNWVSLYEEKVLGLTMTLSAIMEFIIVFGIYGLKRFQRDFKLMTGKEINLVWIIITFTLVPICSSIVLVIMIMNSTEIVRNGFKFPFWAIIIEVILLCICLFPILIGMVYIFIKYRRTNPNLPVLQYLKLCIKPPPYWGPKSKRYWLKSEYYSRRLVKYKDDPSLLASLTKDENMDDLVKQVKKHFRNS